MKTHQITIDTFMMSDLDDLAEIDGEWSAHIILARAAVPGTPVLTARRGRGMAGYIMMRFEPRRLAILRLIADHDDVVNELLKAAKAALIVANRKRLIRKLKRLAINVDMADVDRIDLFRANGFRAASWLRDHGEVVMTWDRSHS